LLFEKVILDVMDVFVIGMLEVIIVMFSILWDLVIDDFGHGIIHNLKF
jgi:hypothetical protein